LDRIYVVNIHIELDSASKTGPTSNCT